MPFLGHNPYDGLDVSPEGTPPVHFNDHSPEGARARRVVQRYATDTDDETMLLELLGLAEDVS